MGVWLCQVWSVRATQAWPWASSFLLGNQAGLAPHLCNPGVTPASTYLGKAQSWARWPPPLAHGHQAQKHSAPSRQLL